MFDLTKIIAMKKIMLLLMLAAINFYTQAQPAHDEPCGALLVPVVQSADACTPTITSTGGVTYNNLAFPSAPCGANTYPDVWYKFVATSDVSYFYTAIANGNGGNAYFIYSAPVCNGALTYFTCGSTMVNTPVQLSNLVIGTTYYIRIGINAGFVVEFGLCVYSGYPSSTSKVGINTNNPLASLDVAGNVSLRHKLGIGEVNPQFPLTFTSNLGDKISLYGNSANGAHYGFGIQGSLLQIYADAAAANIALGYGNSSGFNERARIINQGEYGMTIRGRLQLSTGTNSAGLWLTNMANNQNVSFIGMASDNQVGFYGPGGARWGLTMNTSNANVGIGLNGAQPARPLSFPAALGEKILLYPGGVGEVGIGVYGNELRLHADNPGAKVSFGTQDNAGTFTENAFAQRNGAYAFSILGSLWVNGTTYASDERFKQNISPITSPLQKLMQLNGVEYEMKKDAFRKNNFAAGRQIGLLAQNVEKIIPEAVSENAEGYKGVDYARLVPLLIEAVKDQQKQLSILQQEINDLIKLTKK